MDFKSFWYIAAESRELRAGKPLARVILGEWLVLFRGVDGEAVALQDRCMHRSSQLSRGRVKDGCLQCPYHGWTYDKSGDVVHVPSEGPGPSKVKRRGARRYAVIEQEGYVYVNLSDEPAATVRPFPMPHHGQRGWKTIRLQNRFMNDVTNCAENFVDIPHTIFVHPGIFRFEKNPQRLEASVTRKGGSVVVEYRKETSNFGLFSWFLNASGKEIKHSDSFHMPNITHVEYVFGPRRHFNITSQSVPVTETETLVYTDLTYDYGLWNWVSGPVVRWQGQAIIDQDVEVLGNQMKTMKKYGDRFQNSESDVIHILIESVRAELAKGADPRALPDKTHEIEFWV